MAPQTEKCLLWLAGMVLSMQTLAAPTFDTRPCAEDAAKAGARCGVVYVPENHAKPRGRKIPLNVIVLPATGQRDPKRAQYDLEGGPGYAATDFLGFYASDGAAYREHRDIVLADLRGTGASNPLRCAGIEELERRDPWAPMYPPELVAECAQQLAVANDPSAYSTAAAARDIDLVRRALGYEQLDLNAISYGTTLGLRYIADFPRAVHAAAFMGTVPANRTPPRYHAIAAEGALRLLAEDCRADAACREKFGDVQVNLKAAIDKLPKDQPFAAAIFMEKVRTRLYAPAIARQLPALLASAAKGEYGGLVRGRGEGGRVFADGLYLSITCAESMAHMNVPEAIEASKDTAFGAYRLARQRDACAKWPPPAADSRLMLEPTNDVPTLFLSGGRDPVSPGGWAEVAATAFRSHQWLNVPQAGHVFDGLSGLDTCLDATIIRVFDTGDVSRVDYSCFAAMKPEEFSAP